MKGEVEVEEGREGEGRGGERERKGRRGGSFIVDSLIMFSQAGKCKI